MINNLETLVLGENGFLVKLRCENKFDESMYSEIKTILKSLVSEWKLQDYVPKKGLLIIIELVEFLSRNSNFLNREDSIKVEDASLEIKDILNELI